MKRQAPHERQQPQLHPAQPAHPIQDLQPPTEQPLQPLHPAHPRAPPHRATAQPRQPPPRQPRWAYCSPTCPRFSLSKTKNIPRLTSEISSSVRLIWGPGTSFFNDGSDVDPTAPVAYTPLAIVIVAPTAPATGRAIVGLFLRFCLVAATSELPMFRQTLHKARRPP
jgi:hypothetical protein